MMDSETRVAAVLPAYNEGRYICSAVEMLPRTIVDLVIVVDDASTDDTGELARSCGADRVITHEVNQGVGASLVSGFDAALEENVDAVVVIPGDGQADISALEDLILTAVKTEGLAIADRLTGRDAQAWGMPGYRILGSRILSLMTWIATGVRVPDPQSGYKAIAADALRAIPLESLVKRWGIHNDMISYCALQGIPIRMVSAEPVYADVEGEAITSHIRLWDLIPKHLRLFARLLWRRLRYKASG